ncbi:hypothetical protein BH11PLA2_BH11PLA2_24980 [soil metagenome]
MFRFTGSLAFDNAGNITLSANASVQFPPSVPFVGGVTIGSASVYMQIRPDEDFSNSYVAAWTTFAGATIGFQYSFDKTFKFLDRVPAMSAPYVAPPRDAQYPNQVGGNFRVAPEAGVDGYFIRVTSPRFANPSYTGTRDYLLLFSDVADPQIVFTGNPKSTLNPGALGNLQGQAAYSFAIKNDTDPVPHEQGQVSSRGGSDNERIIFVPKSFFAGSGQTMFSGSYQVMLLSKDSLIGSEPTFTVTPRYQPATAVATTATVNVANGVNTITVTGTAFGLTPDSTTVNIFRSSAANPYLGVLATSVRLDPNNPSHNYNKTTGTYSITTTWNGLPDLVGSLVNSNAATNRFFARVNDGGNPVTDLSPLTTKFTNYVTQPSPLASITITNPSGMTPDLFKPVAFVKASANANAPGGYTALFNAVPTSPNHIAVSGSGLNVTTRVTISVDNGGFIGIGNVNTVVAGAQTMFTLPDFTSPAAAAAFLNTSGNGVRFVANSLFTGKSNITVSIDTTTVRGTKYNSSLTIPVLSNPFFIDRFQGLPADTQGLFGSEGKVFYDFSDGPDGYQFNFANGFAPTGNYRFKYLSGNFRGLEISDTGRVTGTPTSGSDLPVGFPQDAITIGVYDDIGNSDIMTFLIQIAKAPTPAFLPRADSVSTRKNEPRYIEVLANDTYPAVYLDPSLLGGLNPIVSGEATQFGGQAITSVSNGFPAIFYIPAPGFVGVDTFQYRIISDSLSALATVTVNVVDGTPPTISMVGDKRSFGGPVGPVAFTVNDAETPTANLTLSATSSNPTLLPPENISFGGSGSSRTFTLSPTSGEVGSATITLTVADGSGFTVSTSFALTVAVPVPTELEREFSVGRDRGGEASITLRNPDNTVRYTLTPFGANFTGGIRTASGDFTGDGIADLVVASGPGMPGQVLVFDGVTKAQIPTPLPGNQPFGSTFTRGIIVAAGDLNADGFSDLIITAEAGGGARVRIFDATPQGFFQRSDFIALIGGDNKPDSVKFRGGSRATVSDINGDGVGDLIWAAGAGGGPRVATFDGKKLDNGSNVFYKLTGDFFVLSTSLRDGAYLAGGDVNGDGIGDVIAGGGSGAPPQVVGFSGATLIQNNFSKFLDFTFGTNSSQGIRVAVKDLNNDKIADVIVGSAPGAGSRVAAFNGNNLRGSSTGASLFDFTAFAGFSGGVFVG